MAVRHRRKDVEDTTPDAHIIAHTTDKRKAKKGRNTMTAQQYNDLQDLKNAIKWIGAALAVGIMFTAPAWLILLGVI